MADLYMRTPTKSGATYDGIKMGDLCMRKLSKSLPFIIMISSPVSHTKICSHQFLINYGN